jgi:predicted TIM-barrel fold metal-dependent hydrolase
LTAGIIQKWDAMLEELNVKRSTVLTGAFGDAFKRIAELYGKYPERFELWCGLDTKSYDRPDYDEYVVKELENCAAAGAKGVGELVDKGYRAKNRDRKAVKFYDDPRLDDFWQRCAELGLPVSLHVGDPLWSYQKVDGRNEALFEGQMWNTHGKGLPGYKVLAEHRKALLQRHAKTTFIFCHLGNLEHDLASVGRLLDEFPQAYSDISARFRDLARQPRFAREFIIKYQDRLMYATDLGVTREMYLGTFRVLQTADEYFKAPDAPLMLWMAYGLDLPDTVLEKLYHGNADRIRRKG